MTMAAGRAAIGSIRLRPKRCMFWRALPLPLVFPGAGAASGTAAEAEEFSVVIIFLVSKKAGLVRGSGIQ
jgi:hypothetical protein